jgi:hypothetical protein
MKIQDILKESVTDIVARFCKEASADSDKFYNLENSQYKDKNKKYYDEHFKQWFAEDIVPVFTKPITEPQPAYRPNPVGSTLQSPGYRGLQNALAAAGLPYNKNVQNYNPSAPAVISPEMDSIRNAGN